MLAKQAGYMNTFPGRQYVTVYDYTKGAVAIELKSLTSVSASGKVFSGVEWESISSRAAVSGRRMDCISLSSANHQDRGASSFRFARIAQ